MATEFDRTVQLLRDFIRINTTNPPGNEEEASRFLEGVLKGEGLESKVYLPVSGRANIISRIKGKKGGGPAILLSHIDVVPANSKEWDLDPFSGDIKDGYIYGRGTVDMKSQTICHLMAFIALHREGVVPERDIVFLATCDEEVGGRYGVEYMLHQVPELRDASFVISEGGCMVEEGGAIHAQVSVVEKKLSQFSIRAVGKGGHGSTPHGDNANEKIVQASQSIISYKWPMRPNAIVSAYMDGIFKGTKGKGFTYTTLKETIKNRNFQRFIEENPAYNALLRNTATLTILKGGDKVNVIPAESTASFDARLLPSERHETFFKKIKSLCGEDIEITRIGSGISEPAPCRYDTPFFRGLKKIVHDRWGAIPVLPYITTGATDLRYFRNIGVTAYGFFPAVFSPDDLLRMHSANERISLKTLKEGLEGMKDVVRFLALMA